MTPSSVSAVAGAITVHVSAKPKDISDGRKITAVASQRHCVTLALFINVLIIIIIIIIINETLYVWHMLAPLHIKLDSARFLA